MPPINSLTSLNTGLPPRYQVMPACSYWRVGLVAFVTVTSKANVPLVRSGAGRSRAFLTLWATPGSTWILAFSLSHVQPSAGFSSKLSWKMTFSGPVWTGFFAAATSRYPPDRCSFPPAILALPTRRPGPKVFI